MFSFIIPTLGLSPMLDELVDLLDAADTVEEIIIVNNGIYEVKTDSDKIIFIDNEKNNYVNPAWNQGYTASTCDKIVLCNDDILFDPNLLDWLEPKVNQFKGIFGISQKDLDDLRANRNGQREFSLKKVNTMPSWYGVLMIMHRLNYSVIPNDLKIWYGDDFLFMKQYYQNYAIVGSKLQGQLALSSGKKEFDAIKESDRLNFVRKYVHPRNSLPLLGKKYVKYSFHIKNVLRKYLKPYLRR